MASPQPPPPPQQPAEKPTASKKPAASSIFMPKKIVKRAQGTPLRAREQTSLAQPLPLVAVPADQPDNFVGVPTSAVDRAEFVPDNPVAPDPAPLPAPSMASDARAWRARGTGTGYRPPEDTIENLKAANEDYYVKITNRDAQIERQREELSTKREAEKRNDQIIANLQSEVDQWHQDRAEYERRLEQAHQDTNDAKEEVQEVTKRADNFESLFTSTQSELDDKSASLNKAREDLDNARNWTEQLEQSLAEFERQTVDLQAKADYYDDAHAFMDRINRVAEPTFTEMGWELTPANIIEHFENISRPRIQRIPSDTSLHSNSGEALKISRPEPGNRKVSMADELPPSDDEMDVDEPETSSEGNEQRNVELQSALQRVAELEAECIRLRDAEPDNTSEANSLRKQLAAVTEECQNCRKQITELEVQAKLDSTKISSLEKNNEELVQTVGDLQKSMDRTSKPDTQPKVSAETIVLRREVAGLKETNQSLLDQASKAEDEAEGVAKQLEALHEKEKTMFQQINTEKEKVAALQQKERDLLEQISTEEKTVEALRGKEKKLLQQISTEKKEASSKIEQLESRIATLSEQIEESPAATETSTDQTSSKIKKLETRIAVLQAENKKLVGQIASGQTTISTLKKEHELEMEKMEKSKKTLVEHQNNSQESAAAKVKELQKRIDTPTVQTNGSPVQRIVTVSRQRQPDLLEWWSEAPFWMHVLFAVLITLLFFGNASSWMIRHAWVKANDPVLEHLRSLRFVDEPSRFRVWLEAGLGIKHIYLG